MVAFIDLRTEVPLEGLVVRLLKSTMSPLTIMSATFFSLFHIIFHFNNLCTNFIWKAEFLDTKESYPRKRVYRPYGLYHI